MKSEQVVRDLIAKNVRGFREQLGVSQEKLAEYADLHRTFVGFIERAERSITVHTLFKLAKGLSVTAADLVTKDSYLTKIIAKK